MNPVQILVALAGNPNTGKTTLFNALTGSRAKVGNYPGVTVERRSGRARLPELGPVEIQDIPGTYSLLARSADEQVAMSALLGLGGERRPDVVVFCVAATQLVRNLYVVLQAQELGLRTVVALTMMDEAGLAPPDPRAVARELGCEVVPVLARTGEGLGELGRAIARAARSEHRPAPAWRFTPSPTLAGHLAAVRAALPEAWQPSDGLALWALMSIDEEDELGGIPPALRRAVLATGAASGAAASAVDDEVIAARYRWLDRHIAPLCRGRPDRSLTDTLDRFLLHRVAGFAVFLGLMFVVFQSLFAWSEPAVGLVEAGFAWLSDRVHTLLPPGILADFLADGVIAGVGSVLVFLPQILLLFFFIGLMEDSGYMARVAYLMDRIMRSMNLHGRAFVPMLSGFACAVPAIMATRTMERRRDRILAMMVVPLMTCSARLPVYTLIIGALFTADQRLGPFPVQGLLMVAMYLFSTATALAAAWVLSRTVRPLRAHRLPFVIELPPYRLPRLRDVGRMMWERSRLFLREAGTVILACTVVLWALLSFPRAAESPAHPAVPGQAAELQPPAPVPAAPATPGAPRGRGAPSTGAPQLGPAAAAAVPDQAAQPCPGMPDGCDAEAARAAAALRNSYGGRLGRLIEPLLAPLGFDWKIAVGIIGAFAAREVFVSTMGILYSAGDEVDENSDSLRQRLRDERRPDGGRLYTPLVGLSLMVFFALACQCMSTLAVVRRETGGYRWPLFLLGYMTVLAWTASFLLYQGGRLLGFE